MAAGQEPGETRHGSISNRKAAWGEARGTAGQRRARFRQERSQPGASLRKEILSKARSTTAAAGLQHGTGRGAVWQRRQPGAPLVGKQRLEKLMMASPPGFSTRCISRNTSSGRVR
jgi:hypothetical protein